MEVLIGIESVLFSEKKSSTYKFALISALVDYIIENPNEYPQNGFHNIPIVYLAKQWLYYYYPLMIYGEKGIKQGPAQISLHKIIREFVEKQQDKSFSYLTPEAILKIKEKIEADEILDKELTSLLIKIRYQIIDQPLQYIKIASNRNLQEELTSGVKFKEESFALFGLYNNTLLSGELEDYQSIRSKSTAWKGKRGEMSWFELEREETLFIQMGHYTYRELAKSRFFIKDAIIKRWLEYSVENYLQNDSKAIYALFNGLNLHKKEPERETLKMNKLRKIALQIFEPMHCIYCEKEIKSFDLDHFIPWSKYPVDRFWNLFPTCKSCNSKKSDKIVELEKKMQRRLSNYLRVWLSYFKENPEELLILGGKEAELLEMDSLDKSIKLIIEQIKGINNDLI